MVEADNWVTGQSCERVIQKRNVMWKESVN